MVKSFLHTHRQSSTMHMIDVSGIREISGSVLGEMERQAIGTV
jgi:hypothetical protein